MPWVGANSLSCAARVSVGNLFTMQWHRSSTGAYHAVKR